MKVVREDLEGTQVQRLTVIDPGQTNYHVGECVGYRCRECHQCDETLGQIWHAESCRLAGEHGRQHYDDLVPDVPGRPTPELDPSHPITVVKAGETDHANELHNGTVLAFLCSCGNLDEDLFEVIHDETCGLAGRHGPSASRETPSAHP